jgi:hypothetical protein
VVSTLNGGNTAPISEVGKTAILESPQLVIWNSDAAETCQVSWGLWSSWWDADSYTDMAVPKTFRFSKASKAVHITCTLCLQKCFQRIRTALLVIKNWRKVNFYQTTRRNNPEDSHLRNRRRENLKSPFNSSLYLELFQDVKEPRMRETRRVNRKHTGTSNLNIGRPICSENRSIAVTLTLWNMFPVWV